MKIFKDTDLSGKVNSISNKPSLSGCHTLKLFKKSTCKNSSDRVWRNIVLTERNAEGDGTSRRERMAVWLALERLLPYFRGLTLTPEQINNFKGLTDDFGHLYVKVFGEHNVTHYIVSNSFHKICFLFIESFHQKNSTLKNKLTELNQSQFS